MLIINVEKCGGFDRAVKVFKKKAKSTRLVEELRMRKTFSKPYEKKRAEKLKAEFKNNWMSSHQEEN